MKLKNIPNILSVIRIALVPVFMYFFFLDYPKNVIIATGIFLLAGLTDIVDGRLARKFNWITNLGKILDPFADKLMQVAALFCLSTKSLIDIWVAVIYVTKELLMFLGAIFMFRKKKVIVKSDWFGKMSTVIFYLMISVLIVYRDSLDITQRTLIGISALTCAIFALIMYYKSYIQSPDAPAPEEENADRQL